MRKPWTGYELLTLAILTAFALGAFIAGAYALAYLLGVC